MNIAFAPKDEPLVRRKFSADDVIRMVDAGIMRANERVELIEGELVMMASKYAPHENIKHALNRALSRAVGDDLYVAIETSLRLADNIIVEPDITVIATEVFQAPRLATPEPSQVHLVIEVADSSMRCDRQIKARLYARYGVRKFWTPRSERPGYTPTRKAMVGDRSSSTARMRR